MVKFEVDVAFEDESFESVLERLGAAVPEAFVRVMTLSGPGGGWPVLEVMMPEELIGKFAEWYCADDGQYWVEEIAETLVRV